MTLNGIELKKAYKYSGMYNCSQSYMCQGQHIRYAQYQVSFVDHFNYDLNGVTISIFNMSVLLFLSTTEYQSESGYYLYGTGYRFANIGISVMRFYMNQSQLVVFDLQRALNDAYNYFNYQYVNRTKTQKIADQLGECYFRSLGYMGTKVGYSSNIPPDYILNNEYTRFKNAQYLGVVDVSHGQGYINHTPQHYLGETFFNRIVTKMFTKPTIFPTYFQMDEQIFKLFSPNCLIDINIVGHLSVPIFLEIQIVIIICIIILMIYMGITLNHKLQHIESENNFLFVVPQNIRNPKLQNIFTMYILNFDVYLRFFEQAFVFILIIISKNSQMTSSTQFTLISNILAVELVVVKYKQMQVLKHKWDEIYPIKQDIRLTIFIQIMLFIIFNQLYIEIQNKRKSLFIISAFYIFLGKDAILLVKLIFMKKEQIIDKKVIILFFTVQILQCCVSLFLLMITSYNYNILELQNRNKLITIYIIILTGFYILQVSILFGKYLYYSRINMQYNLLYNKIAYMFFKRQQPPVKNQLYIAALYQQSNNDNMVCANPAHRHSQYYDQNDQDFIIIYHDKQQQYSLIDRKVLSHMPCFALMEYQAIKQNQSEMSCPICTGEINFIDFLNDGYFDICQTVKKQQLQILDKQNHTKINVIFVKEQRKRRKNKNLCWTPCGHVYHKDCIMQWIKQGKCECPIDRESLIYTKDKRL